MLGCPLRFHTFKCAKGITKHLPAVLGTTSALSCKDRVRMNINGTVKAGKETCRTGYRWRCQIILGRQTYFHNNASCTFATDFHVEKDLWVRHCSSCKAGNSWNQWHHLRSNLPAPFRSNKKEHVLSDDVLRLSPTLLGGGRGKEEWGEGFRSVLLC